MRRVVVGVVAALTLAACGRPGAVDVGRSLVSDPRLSRSEFNAVSCTTCHDDGSNDVEDRILPGHSLENAVFRPSWWGGAAPTLKDAVDNCMVFFMRESPMEPTAPASRALYEYLLSISPERPSPALPLTVVENVTTIARGDPRAGERVYRAACAVCHGDAFTGTGRLNDLVSIVPDDSVGFAEQSGFPLSVVLIEKVRHGPFFGVGGTMPPFSSEALSDNDLGALIGYLDPL